MRVHSSTIQDVFQIDGRGCVVVPGLLLDADPHVCIGDPAILRRPDGTEIQTFVAGIEMIRTLDRNAMPILLPKTVHKNDVPIGTELVITETRSRDDDPNKPLFNIGNNVSVIINHRNKTARQGTIASAVWHHKYRLWHYYFVDTDGHRISKRYTSYDLVNRESENGK
jgi:hypothetical protein